ncbi:hypothetical protein ACO1O0_007761 [Amphichorda felina]
MLDENLPTYRFRTSSENPLHTLLYYTHNGSEPSADYLIKRPPPTSSHNQYALGLFDIQYASVLYAEVLVKPEWSQQTLSAAEIRANGGNPVSVPITPHTFSVSLYNPDQAVLVKYQQGSWSKDSWEFEVPQRSFRLPSASKIDQEDGPGSLVPELIPKINFRWKRDGRMSRDMTCYMSGRTVDGRKNKEPDITIALLKASRSDGAIAIYEPNMRRVEIEDRKGLEVILLLSAEVIRDLYLAPRQDPFNTAGAPPPNTSKANRPLQKTSGPAVLSGPAAMVGANMSGAVMSGAAMSGALGNVKPSPQQHASSSGPDARMRAEIEAEKRRRHTMIDQQGERERRLQREQEEIKRMLEREQREEQERQQSEKREREKRVNRETEELLKKYGPQPELPPRPSQQGSHPAPPQPPRPRSVEPSSLSGVRFAPEPQQINGSGARKKFGNFLQNSPYAGPVAGTGSGFFAGNSRAEEEKRRKVKKKQSTHF